MISLKQEDEIAKILSELTPSEYASLMKKVERKQWEIIPRGYWLTMDNSRRNKKLL